MRRKPSLHLMIGLLRNATKSLFPLHAEEIVFESVASSSNNEQFLQSLGEDNSFNLDYSSVNQFSFYGLDDYMPIFSNYLFISQEGSKIMLLYSNNGGDDRYISPIYANIKTKDNIFLN